MSCARRLIATKSLSFVSSRRRALASVGDPPTALFSAAVPNRRGRRLRRHHVVVGQSHQEERLLVRAMPETQGLCSPRRPRRRQERPRVPTELTIVPQVKCGGEQPVCKRCATRNDECVYKLYGRRRGREARIVDADPLLATRHYPTPSASRSASRSSRTSSSSPPSRPRPAATPPTRARPCSRLPIRSHRAGSKLMSRA